MKNISKEKIIFACIIFIASVLRFWNYWGWSYSHDELGAFIRLNYSSFTELIREGVQNHDTHPALTQIFLFLWSSAFGVSEISLRFPFVLAGIGSVALVYMIAKKWFNTTTACFSALTIAILDFPVLYSQLARPYSFGLFFSLLAVWCWTNLLFGNGKRLVIKAVYYGLATALCMYTHYFAFFFAMIVASTGFLFLKKETWKPYLISGVIALVLFLPHISISLHQFGMGGVGEWLAKPESDYLWQFIRYGFNESPLVIIAVTLIGLLSVLIYHLGISISKFHFICIAWFLLPFLTGYYYSVTINPVLQYSTLLFSFSFLPIFIFSFFQDSKTKFNNTLLVSAGIILLYSTCIEQRFFKREYFGVFKEINTAVIDLHAKYGEKNIETVLNTSSKEIFDFYFLHSPNSTGRALPSYDYMVGDALNFESSMLSKVDACTTGYFLYGWSNFRSPYEVPEMIKRKFPCIVYDEKHFNSQVTLFGKHDSCARDIVFYCLEDFDGRENTISFDKTKRDTSRSYSGKYSLNIEPNNEFCITLRSVVKNIFPDHAGCVNVSARIFTKDTFNAQIVVDIGQRKGPHDWQAKLLHTFVTKKNTWQDIFVTFELPATSFPEDEVAIYLWNSGKNSFYLDDFTVSSFADSRYNYYEVSYRK